MEVVTQSKSKISGDNYISSDLQPGVYEKDNFLNEGGFVHDMDNDGDKDLIKSASKTNYSLLIIRIIK